MVEFIQVIIYTLVTGIIFSKLYMNGLHATGKVKMKCTEFLSEVLVVGYSISMRC